MTNFMWLLMIMFPGGVCGLSFTSIGSANDDNIFECNANVTLVCKTEKGQDSIVFKINDIQAANCVHGCYVNTPILGNYTVSHDFDGGIIRLHIHKVSAADASNTFTCEGDLTTLSIKPAIKVFPEMASTRLIINGTNSTNVVEIKVITGCVLLQSNLSFVWNKTRYSNGTFLEPLSEEDCISISQVSEEYSNCISSEQCGGTARSNTLTFREETSVGSYYFITCTIAIDKNDTGNITKTYTVISERSFAFKVRDTSFVKNCCPCWGYGVILAGITLVGVCAAVLIKVYYPSGKFGSLWCWEMSILAGFFIVIIYLVVIIIVGGVYKDCDEISDGILHCWEIYLVIFGIILLCITCCMFLYTFIEPVGNAKVISRHFEGGRMSIKVQWESRLANIKTYYIRLAVNGKLLDPIQLDHQSPQDGVFEYELTGLLLDTDYQAHLYSVVCKLSSLNNQLTFDTKGKPMPPTNIFQDEQLRTDDSITLRWTAAKGTTHHFIIKYKISKRSKSVWEISDKISSNWYTINDLRPGTRYTIIVYAENNLGRSEESESLLVKTRAFKPVPPQNFKCTSSTENDVHLSWKPSKKLKDQQFLLTVFNISEFRTQCEQETRITYNGEQTMTHTVSQLNPGCTYQFEIFTSAGDVLSESSKIVFAETKGSRK